MDYQKYLKSEYINLGLDEIKLSPITIFNGVSQKAAESLHFLNIFTVYDLAYSVIFSNADKIANSTSNPVSFMSNEIIPSDVMDGGERFENIENIKFEDIQSLKGIGSENVTSIKEHLNIQTIYDMANWPQYLAAKKIIGVKNDDLSLRDQAVPEELVPTFNEYAVDKSFYTIYTIDSTDKKTDNILDTAIRIEDVIHPKIPVEEKIHTGKILRYEQSWTPIGMGLGNLLHSLALAPGESTRIAIVDWRRSQRVRTTESISQLESLANTIVQNRSISEITNSVAHEAQSGFSQINSNTSVNNNAQSNYGIQNMEETLAATAVGALGGAEGGAIAGGLAGMGIGTIVEPGGGTLIGGAIGAGSGAIIGGTAGGVGAFIGSADFGSSQENTSLERVSAKTVTGSEGTREISASMAQNIMDRTHQYSSSSRNRRASVVQELSQSESENISTRVVTNYNHMHSLTIQYFEVIQMYRVTTKLKTSQDCLYIPFKPIEKWTKELALEFRNEIIQSALHPSILWMFLLAENSMILNLTNNVQVDLTKKRDIERAKNNLLHARTITGTWISDNPYTHWALPKNTYLRFVWWTMNNGSGPWGSADVQHEFSYGMWVETRNGNRYNLFEKERRHRPPLEDTRLQNIVSVTYKLKPHDSNFNLVDEIEKLTDKQFSMEFVFTKSKDSSWENEDEAFKFSAIYTLTKEMVSNNELVVPIISISESASYDELIEHLKQNTDYYSKQILKRKNPKLIRSIINSFDFNGSMLANQVDPEPVALSDNKLIFALKKPLGKKSKDNLPERIMKSDLIPVATEGVFAEAVQGRANSAEKLDISRFWNWQDSPIPIVAPEISPIQAGSRATTADVRPGSLDASLLTNMQPNALPEPGIGTAAILNAISSEMFRDMSGIMQTAQLAQSALEQAQTGATAAGEQSSENLKNGLELTKDLVGKIIKMNSDYATLLASTGFGALTSGGGGVPSTGKSSNRGQTKGGGAGSIPMTDPNTNVSTAGAALNAMKDADKNGKINVNRTKQTDGTNSISGSGGDAPGSLYDEGLGALMGKSGTGGVTDGTTESTDNTAGNNFINLDGTSYFFGKYEVFVADDGSMLVQKGDWLSKYSAAIHGDFWHVYEYARKNDAGQFERIIDIDKIYSGETIYHLPTVYENKGQMFTVLPSKPNITEAKKEGLTIRGLKEIFFDDVISENFIKKFIRDNHELINRVKYGYSFLSLIKKLIKNPLSPLADITIFVFTQSISDITHAYSIGDKFITYTAYAYCITSFAFENHFHPQPSEERIKALQKSSAANEDEKENIKANYERIWDKICQKTENSIDGFIQENMDTTENNEMEFRSRLQSTLRILADEEDKKLASQILESFENDFDARFDRPAWKSLYVYNYPR